MKIALKIHYAEPSHSNFAACKSSTGRVSDLPCDVNCKSCKARYGGMRSMGRTPRLDPARTRETEKFK